MKKLFAAVLSVIMICVGVPLTVSADEISEDGLYDYTVFLGFVTITKYNGAGGAVRIPDEIDDLPVTAIADYAFESINIPTLTIPDSVSTIGNYAFYNCDISTLTLGNGLSSISDGAFAYNNFTEVVIPEGVTSIGYGAFAYCYYLTTLTIPASIESIAVNAFAGSYITEVSIPYHKTDIISFFEDEGIPVNKKCFIDFSANGRPYGTMQTVDFGETATEPAPPTKNGYTFAGWYSDYTLENKFDFRTPITQHRNLYAKFTKNAKPKNTTDTPAPSVTSAPSYAPSNDPPAIPEFSLITQEAKNIDVIAILNKAGSVDSSKTRLEVLRAARTKGVTQITLILPENCKGISAKAIQKCLKAAGDKKLYLSYGDVKIRLTDKSKQILTGV
ncbi:MAG: leucine-rich repeat protein [Ruminococcus sp.]|jgi:uncharacterized repeat protein (TIGR02543 family)|nr:leucine-rich repeat protein [Ruminococcus sp.]